VGGDVARCDGRGGDFSHAEERKLARRAEV
jgi:hypothetical protein